MQRVLFALVSVLAISASSQAQISFKGVPNTVAWQEDCATPMTFVNDTGVDLCDMWVAIGLDEQEDHPEIQFITVQGSGATWKVDDDENGMLDAGETDNKDESADVGSLPQSTSHGWHRVQAAGDGDCIAPGATFTITLCNVQFQELAPRTIGLVGTTKNGEPLDHGGEHGYLIGSDPVRLAQVTPSAGIALQSSPRPPALPRMSFALINDGLHPLPRLRLEAGDPDFDIIDVRANVPITFNVVDNVIDIQPALAPGESMQLWIDLDTFSAVGATTDITITALGLPPIAYCTSKQNSQGCYPSVFGNGVASVSSPQPFMVMCGQVINQKSGLLFYGNQAVQVPFQGGTMCVNPPLKRTPVQSSGGSPSPDNCSGLFAYDFNARIDSGVDPLLAAGREVFAQWWYRDPQSQSTTGLSNGLHFVIDI